MKRQLAAIMFADVVEYSRMMSEDEASALAAVRGLRDGCLEPAVGEYGGDILKRMGDGWVVAFGSVSAAVECAMAIQSKLRDHPSIKLRIGEHIGEIVFDENDFYGAGVNMAQRLESEAPPGGLMVSQDLYRQLSGDLAEAFSDAGSFKLKNIALPVNAYQWRPSKGRAAAVGEVPTIAVELFSHAPDDSETRALVSDLRDQIILRLLRRTGIRVTDQAAASDPDSVYLLRGRLRQSGERGRLQLSLLLRSEGRPVWSETYEGSTADVFEFADSVIEQATADLRLQINAFDGERIADLPVEEMSVSELRSYAASCFYKASADQLELAVELLERALRMKPDDPMSLAMRAEAKSFLSRVRFEKLSEEEVAALQQDVERAVEWLPRSDYTLFARGEFRVLALGEAEGGLKDAERALKITPGYVPGHELAGIALLLLGRYGEAEQALRKSIKLGENDPLVGTRHFLLALSCFCDGRPGDALEVIDQALESMPRERGLFLFKAMCHEKLGQEAAAKAAQDRADKLPRRPSIVTYKAALPQNQAALLDRINPN